MPARTVKRFQKAVGGAVVVAAVALASCPVANAAFPGANGKIAFTGPEGIDTINPDGTGFTVIVPKSVVPPCNAALRPRWSPDGQKLALQCGTTGWTVNPDGTGMAQIGTAEVRQPDWSPDGQRIVFARNVKGCNVVLTANIDGSAETEVVPFTATGSDRCANGPTWSPAGDLIAFFGPSQTGGIYTVRPDGTGLNGPIGINDPENVEWSPAGHRLLYDSSTGTYPNRDVRTMSPDGSTDVRAVSTPGLASSRGDWSPDGTKLVFVRDCCPNAHGLFVANDAGGGATEILHGNYSDPDWQPLPPLPPADPGYPRPRGATPLSVPLVPAFRGCTSPNSAHGPPLAFGSCGPPQQTSDALTVGTPDANGEAPRSVGTVNFNSVKDNPGTPADEADVRIDATLTDVRCRVALAGYCSGGALSDYTGKLEVAPELVRITDKRNGGAERDPATVLDFLQFSVPVPCTDTPTSPTGSTCTVQTSVDALTAGAIKGGMRAIWELGQITVRDGGIDDQQVDAYTTFAVQGLFVP